jgi:hypothetical protein
MAQRLDNSELVSFKELLLANSARKMGDVLTILTFQSRLDNWGQP